MTAHELVMLAVIAVSNFAWGAYSGRRSVRHRAQIDRLMKLVRLEDSK